MWRDTRGSVAGIGGSSGGGGDGGGGGESMVKERVRKSKRRVGSRMVHSDKMSVVWTFISVASRLQDVQDVLVARMPVS
jgi:hypothetical protein